MQRKKLKKIIISLIGCGYKKKDITDFLTTRKKEISSIVDDVRGVA